MMHPYGSWTCCRFLVDKRCCDCATTNLFFDKANILISSPVKRKGCFPAFHSSVGFGSLQRSSALEMRFFLLSLEKNGLPYCFGVCQVLVMRTLVHRTILFPCVFQAVLANCEVLDFLMIARLDLNQYEGDGNVFQDVSLLVNKTRHQETLKSALRKKNATVADAITVTWCSKSPPVFRGKMKVKVTFIFCLYFPKNWGSDLRQKG